MFNIQALPLYTEFHRVKF